MVEVEKVTELRAFTVPVPNPWLFPGGVRERARHRGGGAAPAASRGRGGVRLRLSPRVLPGHGRGRRGHEEFGTGRQGGIFGAIDRFSYLLTFLGFLIFFIVEID